MPSPPGSSRTPRLSATCSREEKACALPPGEVMENGEDLQQANEALRALIGACPLAIIALGNDGRVTMWNPAAERIFGWSEGEVLGQPLPTVPDGTWEEFASGLAASLRGVV